MSNRILCNSPELSSVLDRIDRVAPTPAPVLILGESGVGKELVAREVHRRSRGSAGAMVCVNCAAIPAELFEAEFFGHAAGAFTGARTDRAGHFEAAEGGTLFLDEVSEIPLELQGKLLRVLQEGEFQRMGETKTRRSHARIIAASNKDLRAEVAAGRFREDLYYRLEVFPITIPALRERPSDILPLAEHLAAVACRAFLRAPLHVRASDEETLLRYPWPGNVRQLKNVMERAVLLADADHPDIEAALAAQPDAPLAAAPADALPAGSPGDAPTGEAPGVSPGDAPIGEAPGVSPGDAPTGEALTTFADIKRWEKRAILTALRRTHWRVSGPRGAAAILEVKPTTLVSRMKAMGIARPA